MIQENAPCSPLANVKATKKIMQKYGLCTKKSLGQNFLVNDDVVRHICDISQVSENDHVVEVGPGIGTLTCALLASGADVTAIEQDTRLLPVLCDTCKPWADRLNVINDDVLHVSPGQLSSVNKLTSNLPYAVAATVVLDAFTKLPRLKSACVMVQKEVADRMHAKPGTKDYGAYTVKLALRARPVASFAVHPGNFFPPPHVESTVIRLDAIEVPDPRLCDAASLMANAAFAQRRKTIANSSKAYLSSCGVDNVEQKLASVFERSGVAPTVRGESLPVDTYRLLGIEAVREFPELLRRDAKQLKHA